MNITKLRFYKTNSYFLKQTPIFENEFQFLMTNSDFQVCNSDVPPWSKLTVHSLSTIMTQALKSVRRPHKNKTNMASQF